jgi:hypothetical protein
VSALERNKKRRARRREACELQKQKLDQALKCINELCDLIEERLPSTMSTEKDKRYLAACELVER